MEIVTLKVKVDNSELNVLKSDVNKLNGKTITIKAESATSGLNNYSKAAKGAAEATETLGKTAKAAEKQSYLLGDSLDKIVAKMAAWQILGTIIAKTIGAFKDAVSTMKEVDSALVTVQKTTGYTEEQLDGLTEKAYELAAAYGRTADALLNAASVFARAGYTGKQLEDMTELSALLQNVGDLNESVAAKFLVSANAAWKLNGDAKELTNIIDGMNAVTNQAAVDMEALTTGITVAGSVFANAGESAQTYTALLGTGVAVTQRSGAEISRALRTALMNVRQIKGELEDGEIIDEESISNAAKALNSIGVSVSENGELRKFSDILADLAAKWNGLTSAEQSYVTESIAGKRQANVLLAVLQNYGEYQRQLELYANGAGSAMQENEIYLDSWEAKTQILKSTWTEFISHLIDTDAVKGGLDALIKLVELLDTDIGRTTLTLGTWSAAIFASKKAIGKLIGKDGLKDITTWFQLATTEVGGFTEALTLINPAVWGVIVVVGLLTAAIMAGTKALRDYEDAAKAVKDKEDELKAATDERDALTSKTEELTEAEKNRLYVLNQIIDAEKEQLRLANIEKYRAWQNFNGTGASVLVGGANGVGGGLGAGAAETISRDKWELQQYTDALKENNDAFESGNKTATDYYGALNDLYNRYKDTVTVLREMKDGGYGVSESQSELINKFAELENKLGITKNAVDAITEATKKSAETQKDHVTALMNEASQAGATEKALYDLVAAQIKADTTSMTFSQQISALQALALQANITGNALLALNALQNPNVSKAQIDGYKRTHPGATTEQAQAALLADAWNSTITRGSPNYSYTPIYGGSGAGSAGDSAAKKALEAEKKANELEKKRLQAERDKEIAAIDEQIDLLKKQHSAQEDANKLAELQLAVEKAELELMQAQNERTVRYYNATTKQWEWTVDEAKEINAQQKLDDANRAYENETDKQAYQAQLEVLEAQKKGEQEYWKTAIGRIDDVIDQLSEKISNLNTNVTVNTTVNVSGAGTTTNTNTNNTNNGGGGGSGNSSVLALQQLLNQVYGAGIEEDGKYGNATLNAVKAMQRSLKNGGYYSGSIDGKYGSGTKSALEDYLEDLGGYYNVPAAIYDRGGVLQGLGGIKATTRDEMVLDPDTTQRILTASRSPWFDKVTEQINALYSPRTMNSIKPNGTEARAANINYGPTYNMNGMTINEAQARSMTVYEFAMQSKNLALYNRG